MNRILVVAPSWIGDTLLAQPLLARLREEHPEARIDALAPAWTAPVLSRMPEIAEVITSPFAHGQLRLADRYRLGKELGARDYDAAVVLPNTFKSALVPWFARIPVRIGYVGESRYGLITRRHRLDRKALPLMAERYAQLAEAPGEPVRRPLLPARLAVNEANRDQAVQTLGLDLRKPVAMFCPGAEYGPAKRWPERHFAALARKFASDGYTVWLIGSPRERAIGAEIAQQAEGAAIDLCGRMDLGSAIDLMSLARGVVANDSGLMHVAAALARPLVALYGSSSAEHTPPLSSPDVPARIAKIDIACSPCFKRECPLGHFRCMNDLAPERVAAEFSLAVAGR